MKPDDFHPATRHLENWAAWMQLGKVGRGYPSRSAGLASGGASTEDTFDEMCDEADVQQAKVCNAIIIGMHPAHQAVISYVHGLSKQFYFPGGPEKAYAEAVESFWKKAQGRGLV